MYQPQGAVAAEPAPREARGTCSSSQALRLLSMRSGCRPFEPPPIILGSISKALRLAGTAGSPAAPVALLWNSVLRRASARLDDLLHGVSSSLSRRLRRQVCNFMPCVCPGDPYPGGAADGNRTRASRMGICCAATTPRRHFGGVGGIRTPAGSGFLRLSPLAVFKTAVFGRLTTTPYLS